MLTEDQIFRLTGVDYANEFQALIPFLKETYGKRFQSATLYYDDDGAIIRLNQFVREQIRHAYAPLSMSSDRMLLQVVLDTGKYNYFLDRIGLWTYSHPFGRKPIKDWIHGVRTAKFRCEARRRIAPIKEELMAAAWSPRRVERLLAAGGYDALD